MKHCRFALNLSLALFLTAGCSGLPGSPLPTLIPEEQIPTVIELTAQALIDQGLVTPLPTGTIDPDVHTPTPSITETPTSPAVSPTPTLDIVLGTLEPAKVPNPLPPAEIQIISPGRLSRVQSPIRLHLYLVPPRNDRGEDVIYRISLYGENARLISRETITRTPEETRNPHLVQDLDFKITGQAQSARLEISAIDPFDRVTAIETTDVILLKEGDEEIKTILDLGADMIIQDPVPSSLIQGESLFVRGFTRIAPEGGLQVECLNRDGGKIGSGKIEVDPEDLGGGYHLFEGEIPFQVGYSSWIRVQIFASDGQFSGIQSLSSIEVLVSP